MGRLPGPLARKAVRSPDKSHSSGYKVAMLQVNSTASQNSIHAIVFFSKLHVSPPQYNIADGSMR